MTKQTKSYQDLKMNLEAILSKLQNDDVTLDEAIELHKQGETVLKELEAYLADVTAKTKLDIKIK
jgi:exodeoxyribonuclease VII small subunit